MEVGEVRTSAGSTPPARRPSSPAGPGCPIGRAATVHNGSPVGSVGERVRAARGGDAAAVHVELPATGEIVLVVGPEGGITPDELAAFETAGAQAVRLGSTVLRTSTAGPAASPS